MNLLAVSVRKRRNQSSNRRRKQCSLNLKLLHSHRSKDEDRKTGPLAASASRKPPNLNNRRSSPLRA